MASPRLNLPKMHLQGSVNCTVICPWELSWESHVFFFWDLYMNNFVTFTFLDNDYKCLCVPHCPVSVC